MALQNPLPLRPPAVKNATNIHNDEDAETNTTFRSSLRIDMKQLVSVGKVRLFMREWPRLMALDR